MSWPRCAHGLEHLEQVALPPAAHLEQEEGQTSDHTVMNTFSRAATKFLINQVQPNI